MLPDVCGAAHAAVNADADLLLTFVDAITVVVRSLDQYLNIHPKLAYTLRDLFVDTLFASIGQ